MSLIMAPILFSIPQAGKLGLRVEAEGLRVEAEVLRVEAEVLQVEAEEGVAGQAVAQLRLLYHSSSSSASR